VSICALIMAIPDYQSIMLPLLRLLATRPTGEFSAKETTELLGQEFNLTQEELQQLLPSGTQGLFANRAAWARTYLKQAKLIEPTRRGFFTITDRGRQVLDQPPQAINVQFLMQFPEFVEFRTRRSDQGEADAEQVRPTPANSSTPEPDNGRTPEESLELEYQKIRSEFAVLILERIMQCSPAFFERLVVELLVKMGYGGSRSDAGKALGRSGDGGIDGIIKEDRLGLDVIYIQAKRWGENSVGRPDIQQFAGALQGQRASKGIFITTSRYTREAQEYVAQIGSKIVLIDGEQLAQYMIDNNVGVSVAATYEIKRIDSDYFTEEE
jgi:restriction system protein